MASFGLEHQPPLRSTGQPVDAGLETSSHNDGSAESQVMEERSPHEEDPPGFSLSLSLCFCQKFRNISTFFSAVVHADVKQVMQSVPNGAVLVALVATSLQKDNNEFLAAACSITLKKKPHLKVGQDLGTKPHPASPSPEGRTPKNSGVREGQR